MIKLTQIKQIGIVHSEFPEPADPFKMREKESTIEIFDDFVDGLQRLEENDYIQVVFDFHKAKDYKLVTRTYDGTVKGVFASRSPRSNAGKKSGTGWFPSTMAAFLSKPRRRARQSDVWRKRWRNTSSSSANNGTRATGSRSGRGADNLLSSDTTRFQGHTS